MNKLTETQVDQPGTAQHHGLALALAALNY